MEPRPSRRVRAAARRYDRRRRRLLGQHVHTGSRLGIRAEEFRRVEADAEPIPLGLARDQVRVHRVFDQDEAGSDRVIERTAELGDVAV